MRTGFSFLQSKLGRRFLLLFILCAFVPTIVLIIISYSQVVSQLEEQSYLRLRREVSGYSMSLYDRLIRMENDLESIGRFIAMADPDPTVLHRQYGDVFEELFNGLVLYRPEGGFQPLNGAVDTDILKEHLTKERVSKKKPFLLNLLGRDGETVFFIGLNILTDQTRPFSVIAEIKSGYLWGFGPSPLLPPMTELSVYDRDGNSIIASMNGPAGNYNELDKKQVSEDLRVFRFKHNGRIYHGSRSNLFLESRFQDVGWTIILSIARKDVMAALDDFKKTFPFITLLFLLIISYLSLLFIRKGLGPLHILQKGTQRIAKKDFTTPVEINSGDEFQDLGRSFNKMMGELDNQFQALTVLNEIDRAILSSLDRKEIVATTLQRLKNFFTCKVAAYVKKSEESVEHLTVYRLEGRRVDDPIITYYQVSQEEQLQIFTEEGHSYISAEASQAGFLREISGARSLRFLCLPLSVKNKTRRSLLLGYDTEHSFSEEQLAQARKIANQLAIALANSILVDELETLAQGTIAALARTVDAKSKWTHGHSERVAEISVKIAEAMRLSDDMVESIGRAGLLHDIGKIATPLKILDKPDRLTDEEYDNIKNHPVIGAQILEPIEAYKDILPIVQQHHEKYDGSGYPWGLEKENIDIRARIMAVADVWDALVSDRPYREGWVSKRAKELIMDGKGRHFDPKVVDVFMTLLTENQDVFSI
jgi:putative nucleotidyltransferase with HDIG domain